MSREQVYRGEEFAELKRHSFVLNRNSKCTHFKLKVLIVKASVCNPESEVLTHSSLKY